MYCLFLIKQRIKLSPNEATVLLNNQRYWLQLIRAPRPDGNSGNIIFDVYHREIHTNEPDPTKEPHLLHVVFEKPSEEIAKKYVPIPLLQSEMTALESYNLATWTPIITRGGANTIHALRLTDQRLWQSLPTLVVCRPSRVTLPPRIFTNDNTPCRNQSGRPRPRHPTPVNLFSPSTTPPASWTGAIGTPPATVSEHNDNTSPQQRQLAALVPTPPGPHMTLYRITIAPNVLAESEPLRNILRRVTNNYNKGNIYLKRRPNILHEYFVFFDGPPAEESAVVSFGRTKVNFRKIPAASTSTFREVYKKLNADKIPDMWIPISNEPHNFSLFRPVVPDRLHKSLLNVLATTNVRDRRRSL